MNAATATHSFKYQLWVTWQSRWLLSDNTNTVVMCRTHNSTLHNYDINCIKTILFSYLSSHSQYSFIKIRTIIQTVGYCSGGVSDCEQSLQGMSFTLHVGCTRDVVHCTKEVVNCTREVVHCKLYVVRCTREVIHCTNAGPLYARCRQSTKDVFNNTK